MTNLRTRKQQLVWLLSAFADLLPLKNRKRFPCKPKNSITQNPNPSTHQDCRSFAPVAAGGGARFFRC